MTKLVQCKNLAFAYDGKTVQKDISFEVSEGEYLCIAGENGGGKSTLIKGILGLITPYAGTIEFKNGLKRSEIGYLPQQTAVQKDFPASVYEITLSGCLNSAGLRPFFNKKDKNKVKENLELMGVYELRKRCFRELSGGEQRRVLLARALCSAGKLLVLDEPVSGLDPAASRELYEVVQRLNKERGIAVIMVSHDINAAITHSDKILCLYKEANLYCTPKEFLQSELGRILMGGHENV